MRQRTAGEHADAFYERLMDLGWVHSHVDKIDFVREFQIALVDADKKIAEESDPLETFSEFNMTRARIDSESTYSREQDRTNATNWRGYHSDTLARWDPDYWWRPDCPACRNEGKRHAPGCPGASVPGGNTPDPKKNPGGVRAA